MLVNLTKERKKRMTWNHPRELLNLAAVNSVCGSISIAHGTVKAATQSANGWRLNLEAHVEAALPYLVSLLLVYLLLLRG